MNRTFNTLRLFAAAAALLLALLAAPVARAWARSGASVHWLAMAGEPAAPDQCTAGFSTAFGTPPIAVNWRDNSDNEDGFTVEWWMKIKGKWVLQGAQDRLANQHWAWFPLPTERSNRYRVRAVNANGVSAWSNWAELTIK